jgi:hypothetical protein
LIKEDILHPLDFPILDHCINCIKEKYVKQIKKGGKRSTRILEIIHMEICDPFPTKSMDGCDLFVTFTRDFLHYGYIYSIKE